MYGVHSLVPWSRGFFRLAQFFILLAATAVCVVVSSAASSATDEPPQSAVASLKKESVAEAAYIGDEECRSCHQNLVSTYHLTAHYITSRLPTKDSISGKFTPGSNILATINTNLFFEMDATERGFFQMAVMRQSPTDMVYRAEHFDVVIGSSRKGQTYLFWKGGQLFELPVSYWVGLDEWVNSPGYRDGSAFFSKGVTPRCLECHATSFKSLTPPLNRYDKTSLVLGITCEKCHGPGGGHAARYRAQPPPKSPSETAIINTARLSRDRQIDLCALCHSGGSPLPNVPSLSYKPGDVLAKFLDIPIPAANAHVDVHGGTVHLLEKSRCFQSSETMTCTTCHNVHTAQRDLAAFASNCLTCHKVEKCGVFPKLGHEIDTKCVICHMPLQQTDQIISSVTGRQLQPKVRNHQIGIYPEVHLP